jgi:hypothetical protein
MDRVVYRHNHRFHINTTRIKSEFRSSSVINGLYAAIYEEFMGASQNEKYKKLTPIEKLDKINEFATKWLEKRGFLSCVQ